MIPRWDPYDHEFYLEIPRVVWEHCPWWLTKLVLHHPEVLLAAIVLVITAAATAITLSHKEKSCARRSPQG